jgi:hypothetical protein
VKKRPSSRITTLVPIKQETICKHQVIQKWRFLDPCGSSKIISHSLRLILVEGEYCLSTNNLHIHGEIAPGAPDNICSAFYFVEPFPRPLGTTLDGPEASSSKAALPQHLACLSVFSTGAYSFAPARYRVVKITCSYSKEVL